MISGINDCGKREGSVWACFTPFKRKVGMIMSMIKNRCRFFCYRGMPICAQSLPADRDGCGCWSYLLYTDCPLEGFVYVQDSCYFFNSKMGILRRVLKPKCFRIHLGGGRREKVDLLTQTSIYLPQSDLWIYTYRPVFLTLEEALMESLFGITILCFIALPWIFSISWNPPPFIVQE